MFSPVLNGEQLIEGAESEGGSADISYAKESEGGSDGSKESEEVESPPCTERRTKAIQDQSANQGNALAPSVRHLQYTRSATPDPSE